LINDYHQVDVYAYQLQFAEDFDDVEDLAVISAAAFRQDLLPDLILPLWVHAEQEHGPDQKGGRGFLPCGKEGLPLIDNLPGGQRLGPPLLLRRPCFQQQADKIVPVAAALGRNPFLHDCHDLGPQQPVQIFHTHVAASWQVPDEHTEDKKKREALIS
jgi:hypothetical protein